MPEKEFFNHVSELESVNQFMHVGQVVTPPPIMVFTLTTPPPSRSPSPPSRFKKGKGGKKSTKREGREYIELRALPPSGSDRQSTSADPNSGSVSVSMEEEGSGGEGNLERVPLHSGNASDPPAVDENSVQPPHHQTPTLEVIMWQVIIMLIHGLSIVYFGCRYYN